MGSSKKDKTIQRDPSKNCKYHSRKNQIFTELHKNFHQNNQANLTKVAFLLLYLLKFFFYE